MSDHPDRARKTQHLADVLFLLITAPPSAEPLLPVLGAIAQLLAEDLTHHEVERAKHLASFRAGVDGTEDGPPT